MTKKLQLSIGSLILLVVILAVLLIDKKSKVPRELERAKISLPVNSYDIQDLGNNWIAFSLDSTRFMIYTQTHQRCITQVK